MFGFLRPPKITDPQLGELMRSRGYWRGTIGIDSDTNVPLAVAGGRTAPEPAALAAARKAAVQFSSLRSEIGRALYEHYEPYAEAIAAGELPSPGEDFPKIGSPSEVWPHVEIAFVSILPMGDSLITEVGLRTVWDEEHTLGARIEAGKLVELCGSTIPS